MTDQEKATAIVADITAVRPPPISTKQACKLWIRLHDIRHETEFWHGDVAHNSALEPEQERLYKFLTLRLVADASFGYITIKEGKP